MNVSSRAKTSCRRWWKRGVWPLTVLVIIGAWLAIYYRLRELKPIPFVSLTELDHAHHGTIGDAFGPITALFAILAFAFSLRTSRSQQAMEWRFGLREEAKGLEAFLAQMAGMVAAIIDQMGAAPRESPDDFKIRRQTYAQLLTPILADRLLFGRLLALHRDLGAVVFDTLALGPADWTAKQEEVARTLLTAFEENRTKLIADYQIWLAEQMGHSGTQKIPPNPHRAQGDQKNL